MAIPLVVNTWGGVFIAAADSAFAVLQQNSSAALAALVRGCADCERRQCDRTVGFGGRPDTIGEVTLDALVMDGRTMNVGAVAYLRRIKNAIGVAHAVMEHSAHTLLAGDGATAFAKSMGFPEESLSTGQSDAAFAAWWNQSACQPNYYRNLEGAADSCPPYPVPQRSIETFGRALPESYRDAGGDPAGRESSSRPAIDEGNHDTIGMVVIGAAGAVVCGTSTNGAAHKIAGRVGDAPIPGSGCYADAEVGAAAATGDGDVMMRFSPALRAVQAMGQGAAPQEACARALCVIARYYPSFGGALVCANAAGAHGAASHALPTFKYSYRAAGMEAAQVADGLAVDAALCESYGLAKRRVGGPGDAVQASPSVA